MKKIFTLFAAIAAFTLAANAQTDFLKNLRTNTNYSTFDAAKQALQAGDTLLMTADYNVTSPFIIDSTTPAFVLDMNGHILNGSGMTAPTTIGDNACIFFNEGSLTIVDGNPTTLHNTGNQRLDTLQGAVITGGQGYCLVHRDNGLTIVEGGAIRNSEHASLTVDGIFFYGNHTGNDSIRGYAGVIRASGTTVLRNCVFGHNQASYYAGVVDAVDGTVDITNCIFYKDSAYFGGAIGAAACIVTIDSCKFHKNDAVKEGGAIDVSSDYSQGSLTITHSEIRNNTAGMQSAGIDVAYSDVFDLTIGDGTVITNNVTTNAEGWPSGGVYTWRDLNAHNVTLTGNVVIKDNLTIIGNDTISSDLCLSGHLEIDLPVIRDLGPQSEIGIITMLDDTLAMGLRFTQDGTADQVHYFFSDVAGYEVAYNEAGYLETRKITNGIEDIETLTDCYAYTEGRNIVVAHAAGHTLALYDVMGRMLKQVESTNENEHFAVPAHGIYVISIDGQSTLRVVMGK